MHLCKNILGKGKRSKLKKKGIHPRLALGELDDWTSPPLAIAPRKAEGLGPISNDQKKASEKVVNNYDARRCRGYLSSKHPTGAV